MFSDHFTFWWSIQEAELNRLIFLSTYALLLFILFFAKELQKGIWTNYRYLQ